ncbi:tachykinin-like peptides receptor 99D isoform X3 [Nomia melanderi]|uniref:tachykinin-like peptides receptor 99D isoform X3 n=1 Tax=Nomia melanderi TaxID=2448451 RepID=UPI0013043E38|nr:tachykinin-like peptides receptor 99D isoform X2 [Nomia melanderi]
MDESGKNDTYNNITGLSNITDFVAEVEFSCEIDEGEKVPPLIVVILSILYGSTSILTMVGNSIVIWIIATTKRMQDVTNFYIANLALADIVIGLFVSPLQYQAALLQKWISPHFMCAICPFVQVLCVNASVFTLTAIAIDRHRAILKPLSAKPSKLTAKIVIMGIWLFAAILAIPAGMAYTVTIVHKNFYGEQNVPMCAINNISHKKIFIYSTLLVLFQFLTPLSVISLVYTRMALKLWSNRAPGNAESSRDANLMKNKMRVIKMLIVVVAVFAICWLPVQIYHALKYCYEKINCYEYINYIFLVFNWLAMSNSCYNPLIYGIYNGKFRRELRQRCPCKLRNRATSPPINNTEMDKTQSSRTSIRYAFYKL